MCDARTVKKPFLKINLWIFGLFCTMDFDTLKQQVDMFDRMN